MYYLFILFIYLYSFCILIKSYVFFFVAGCEPGPKDFCVPLAWSALDEEPDNSALYM
jgi:hypothetical protein